MDAATSPSRLYPARPLLAVSIAAFRDGRALLMTRAKPPAQGLFTLPGGLVEAGETLEEACLRELREETGAHAKILGFVDHHAVIERDGAGAVRRHYLIACFAGLWIAGEPRPSEEAADLVWAAPEDWPAMQLTRGLQPLLRRAQRIAEEGRQ